MPSIKRYISPLLSLLVLAGAVFAVSNRQPIIDWWRLRDYNPPARIVELSEHTAMSDEGQKLFYVHHPVLSDKQDFAFNCPRAEQTIVLGCYVTHRAIYIFDVDDPRLDGIEEVTAAHEMLHAAYDRLDSEEKARVDSMTAAAYAQLKDKRIQKVVESYQNRDASVVPNELHSILATEVRSLPAELEEYYKRYFDDRSKVVAYSEAYEAVFSAQQEKLDSLSDRISSLESELKQTRAQIEAEEAELRAESAELNQLRASGQTEEYNSRVPGFNARVAAYQSMIESFNAKVKTLNALIKEYNNLAVEQRDLFDALDSGL